MTQSPASDRFRDDINRADAAAAGRRTGEALKILHGVIDAGGDDFETLLKAASLHRANSQPRDALALVERALGAEPLHFVGLMFRATLLEHLGDPGAPEAFGAALAQRGLTVVPPHMETTIARAQQLYDAYRARSAESVEALIAPQLAEASSLEQVRLKRFVSNMTRQTRVHHCEPTNFHFPGLAEYEFHDRSFFPWLAELEAATATIRDELIEVMKAERAELVPYVQYADAVPMQQWKPLNQSLDWTAIHLINKGEVIEANASHCPKTMAAIAKLPQPDLPGDAPNAMFSLLKPHTTIPPHQGVANFRLVCHLPLIVPAGCWFRVGAERREWVEGEGFVFDDTIEHEAANPSDELRAVLIVDVWHPGLSPIERAAIQSALSTDQRMDGGL